VTSQASQHNAHPVFCLLRNGLKDHLGQFLDLGERKIDRWFHQLKYVEVLFPNDAAFANINTPAELSHFERVLS
jgi:molybdopterin-guanine dinucleotide biosynthesis protein A